MTSESGIKHEIAEHLKACANSAMTQRYIKHITIVIVLIATVIITNVIGKNIQGIRLDARILTALLAVFYAMIASSILFSVELTNETDLLKIQANPKIILLLKISRRFDIIPGAIFFLILHFGAFRAIFGAGHLFMIMSMLGTVLVAATAILLKMTIKMMSIKISSSYLFSVRRVELLCKMTIVTLTVAICTTSAFVTRSDLLVPKAVSALTSPFGATIPIVGWASAIVSTVSFGNLNAVAVPIILNVTFIAIMILMLLIFDINEYEYALCDVTVSHNNERYYLGNSNGITNVLIEKIYTIFNRVSGDSAAMLYCSLVNILRMMANSIHIFSVNLVAISLYVMCMNKNENQFMIGVIAITTSVLLETIQNSGEKNLYISANCLKMQFAVGTMTYVPKAFVYGVSVAVTLIMFASFPIQTAILIMVLRAALSIVIYNVRIILHKYAIPSSIIVISMVSILTYGVIAI